MSKSTKRRLFVSLLGGAMAAVPLRVGAQSRPAAVTTIGLLASAPASAPSGPVPAMLLGLKQAGYDVGENLHIEYRYADNQPDRLPALAAELVRIPVALIMAAGGNASTLAAKAATSTIPIVFAPTADPVGSGIVASLNRPGGNITGIAALTIELDPKRLELLAELAPGRGPLAVLLNPDRPDATAQVAGITATARSLKRELVTAQARNPAQIDTAFAALAQQPVAALLVGADSFFSSQRAQIVDLARRYRWPAIYQWREFAEAGGLASYGPSLFESYRQVGLFAGRILKGEKPGDLPVQQPTKFAFVINTKVARELGLAIPESVLSRADDLIE